VEHGASTGRTAHDIDAGRCTGSEINFSQRLVRTD
jgi:hypothetical protein